MEDQDINQAMVDMIKLVELDMEKRSRKEALERADGEILIMREH